MVNNVIKTTILIVGAGMAGLAAAQTLRAAQVDAIVLEARDRVGGRVWTDTAFAPVPVERGAEFIHGAHVRTWEWVRRAQLRTAKHPTWAGRRLVLGENNLAGEWLIRTRPDLRRVMRIERELAAHNGPDQSFADWMRERRYSPLAMHLADVRLSHSYCTEPGEQSVRDLADELRRDTDAGGNFRILNGYQALLETLSDGIDVRLGTPVRQVTWQPDGVAIDTDVGSFAAQAAIITLPLAVLQADLVRFDPPLPKHKRAAINQLAMHPAIKVLLRFSDRFWPADTTFVVADTPVPVWWTVRPDQPLLTGFITGQRAARLARHGTVGIGERALGALGEIFGSSVRRLLVDMAVVNWGTDPWALGGYSSVPVGAVGARQHLAEPCGALQFAGEATVTVSNPATVHGALESGERAAHALLAQIGASAGWPSAR